MSFKVVPSQWSHHVNPQYFAPQNPISSTCLTKIAKKWDPLTQIFLSSTNMSKNHHVPISRGHTMKRSCSGNMDDVFEEMPSEYIKGFTHGSEVSDDIVIEEQHKSTKSICTVSEPSFLKSETESFSRCKLHYLEPLMLGEWPEREELMRANIERKANRFEIPLSLRMIKKKRQTQGSFRDVGNSNSCSMAKAFSSMEFIIIELQSCALQMREVLCHEDLGGIIAKVQREMHISFVWLFQHVFSRTPALMISVMILLSDFSLYSTAHNIGYETRIEAVTKQQNSQTDSLLNLDSFIGDSRENGKRKKMSRPLLFLNFPDVVYDHEDSLEIGSLGEMKLWNSMVDEAEKMQIVGLGNKVLDFEEIQWLVPPITVEVEPDDYMDYFRTDLLYQMGLSKDPNNLLMLCNYGQFLHLVARDYDRAEECFKRAIQVEPLDAESLSQYANFLWKARKDLWGAEERYQQSIAAEPQNTYYTSRYANFLWSTGGEDTCYPLNTSHNNSKASNL